MTTELPFAGGVQAGAWTACIKAWRGLRAGHTSPKFAVRSLLFLYHRKMAPKKKQTQNSKQQKKSKNGGGNGKAQPASRSQATHVLAQGVAGPATQVFGSDVTFDGRRGLKATDPVHLPLPRPVAPYTVIRINKRFSSNHRILVFGTYRNTVNPNNDDSWSMVCCAGTSATTGAIGGSTTNWKVWFMPSLAQQGLTLVPAAYTVQCMNPAALQSTSGIAYASMTRQQLNWYESGLTGAAFEDQLIQVNPPRLLSAAKLSLRGVEADLMPASMSQLSEFRPATVSNTSAGSGADGDVQFNSAGTDVSHIQPDGFLPVYVVNPTPITLEFLVTVEYRVRFNVGNLAAASHRQYPHAPLNVWDRAVQAANNLGHGVRDIAEVVANAGQAYNAASEAAGALRAAAKGASLAAAAA